MPSFCGICAAGSPIEAIPTSRHRILLPTGVVPALALHAVLPRLGALRLLLAFGGIAVERRLVGAFLGPVVIAAPGERQQARREKNESHLFALARSDQCNGQNSRMSGSPTMTTIAESGN